MAAQQISTQVTAVDEMLVVWKWFEKMDKSERRKFLESVITFVTPHKLFALAQQMTVAAPAPTPESQSNCFSFQDKLSFFRKLLSKWTEKEANDFLTGLEDIDYPAMCHLYDQIASTAQEP